MKHPGALRLVTGLVAASVALGPADASQRQAELVAFRDLADGVVIDVGRTAPKPLPPSSEQQGVSPEALQDDFRSIALAEQAHTTTDVPSPPIAIPLWMQTGRVMTGAAQVAQSVVAPYMYSPAACSMTPYRPRGDLAPWQEARRARYFPLISAVACEAGVPTGLLDALVAQESRYDPLIVSNKGAVGLTQLMPDTARGLGV
ncbi:hypothetical protein DC429_18355, partial [Arthrobacter sp. TPD3018]